MEEQSKDMKPDIYSNGRIYVSVPNHYYMDVEHLKQNLTSYPVTGNHSFKDGQDVTGLYELKKEYWGNGYWIPEEHYSGEKERKNRTVAVKKDRVEDDVRCGNCGSDFHSCECGEWNPIYGQTIAPVSTLLQESPDMGKEVEGDLLANNSKPEYVICAAVHYQDGNTHKHQPKNIQSGFVVCGRRHHNCFMVASVMIEGYAEFIKPDRKLCVQGFLTSKDRFLDRKEAGKLAFEQKQISKLTDCLFSEDLY